MKPSLIIICGYIGVGKTTTANLLGKMLKVPVFSVDTTIKRLFGQTSNSGKDAIFNKHELNVCYNFFSLMSEIMLLGGRSIIIDGGFARQEQRKLVISSAKKTKSPYHILHVTCPEPIVRERSSKRFKSGKGVGWHGYLQLKKIYEPLNVKHYEIDSSQEIEPQLKIFIKQTGLSK